MLITWDEEDRKRLSECVRCKLLASVSCFSLHTISTWTQTKTKLNTGAGLKGWRSHSPRCHGNVNLRTGWLTPLPTLEKRRGRTVPSFTSAGALHHPSYITRCANQSGTRRIENLPLISTFHCCDSVGIEGRRWGGERGLLGKSNKRKQ